MKKLIEKIKKWVGLDGLLHALACYAIGMTAGAFVNHGLAFSIAVFIGLAKEAIWDSWMKRGSFEFKDLACDLIGAAASLIIQLTGSWI